MKEYRSQQLTAPQDGVFKIKCGASETTIWVKQDQTIQVVWEPEPNEIPDSD
tara:strand:- start:690 stop:845 length:156 start_codon:yes stop_codon:yes gene_type:complete